MVGGGFNYGDDHHPGSVHPCIQQSTNDGNLGGRDGQRWGKGRQGEMRGVLENVQKAQEKRKGETRVSRGEVRHELFLMKRRHLRVS